MGGRPCQRSDQAAVLSDVIGRQADCLLELDDRSVFLLDSDAVARGTRIAARPAVNVRACGAAVLLTEQRRLVHADAPSNVSLRTSNVKTRA